MPPCIHSMRNTSLRLVAIRRQQVLQDNQGVHRLGVVTLRCSAVPRQAAAEVPHVASCQLLQPQAHCLPQL